MTQAAVAAGREAAGAAYDEVPYHSVALLETHPGRMAAVARLLGLDAAPVASCRVLELGCAGGGNLVPMALGIPGGTFVGVDLSPRQVAQAEALAASAGATNVAFRAGSLADLGDDLGTFDYVICHGVYSWVPEAVREAVLDVCSRLLADRGVAYVSYNVYPGWHIPGMIREMMVYHVRDAPDPAARVQSARALLDFLGENATEKDGHYAKILRDEATQLRPHSDSYLLHEHLEEINHPVYFHQFADRAAAHGLKYLGDARYYSMASSVNPTLAAMLDRLASDPLDREQYFDFLCNRRFRRTLLCRASAETSPRGDPRVVKTLRAASLVRPKDPTAAIASNALEEFLAADGSLRISTSEPLLKAALVALAEATPSAPAFEELWATVRDRLAAAGADPGEAADRLAARLLQSYGGHAVEFHAYAPPIDADPGEAPRAFPVARVLAEQGGMNLPNLWHGLVNLSDFDRLVLRQLDGRSDRATIVEALVASVVAGGFTVHQDGRAVHDPAVLRPLLARSLPPSLQRLARAALLMR